MTQVIHQLPPEISEASSPSLRAKIKIAYVIGSLRSGGTEGQVLELIRHIDRTRFEPYLILMEDAGRENAETLVTSVFTMGIPQSNSSRWFGRSISFAGAVLRTSRCLRQWECDIVHAYLPGPSILAGAAARLAKVPVLIGSRRSLPSQYRSRSVMAGWADTAAFRLATYNLGNSDAVSKEMISIGRCPSNKCGTILNGVDTARFCPNPSSSLREYLGWTRGELVLGLIGNFRTCKRHVDYVDAAKMIAQRHPHARFLMAGADAGTREAVRRQVAALGLEGKVRILNSDPTPEKLFAALDIYVCTSTAEGFSNAILEAMACGNPVIATEVGGNPEAVLDGYTGLLVPPHTPAAIALAAESLITNRALRLKFGMQARKRVIERFSLDAMVHAHEQLYLRLTSESQERIV